MICTLLNAIRISEAALGKFERMMAQPKQERVVLKLDLSISATVVNELVNKDRRNGRIYNEIAVVMVRMGGLA